MSELRLMQPFSTLSAAQRRRWTTVANAGRAGIEGSPAYAEAIARSGNDVQLVVAGAAWCPLVDGAEYLTTICQRYPVVAEGDGGFGDVLEVLRRERRQVYMPLVDSVYEGAAAEYGIVAWPRRANPVIDWSSREETLYERALRRGTSQIARKRRRLEAEGYSLSFAETGEDAARKMLEVDARSWKAARGQGMAQRGNQAALYSRLITEGAAQVSFLQLGSLPVAFRIDSLSGTVLRCLKWSFDESHRRFSPGLYLLTTGLDEEWGRTELTTVDLHGGPDSMKQLIESRREERSDLWLGETCVGERLREERMQFDALVSDHTLAGGGLRHAF